MTTPEPVVAPDETSEQLDAVEQDTDLSGSLDSLLGAGPQFLPSMSQDQFGQALGGVSLPGLSSAPDVGSPAGGLRARIVANAKSYLGTPYVWGGTSRSGVDCSGFVQQTYAAIGIDLPRISYQQARSGKPIDLRDLKPGDLVAWNNSSRNNGADHIAIALGDGYIAEAPRPGVPVRIRKLASDEWEHGAWGVDMSQWLGGR